MRALRGKSSNLSTISKFFNANESAIPNLLRFQLFNSVNDDIGNGQFRKYATHGYNGRKNGDYDDDNGDKSRFSGRNRGNFNAQKNFRSSNGERKMPQYQKNSDVSDRNNNNNYNDRRQGRNDGFKKPFGGDGSKPNMKLNDDFFKFDGIEESSGGGVGLGGDHEGRKGSQPSVSELLNKPEKGERGERKEGSDFLEKFKLGSVDKAEEKSGEVPDVQASEEEKVEEPANADEIFKKMKQSGLIPNAVAMLDGLCKDGLVQEAMKLFGLMREKGSMPEVVVYTAVVEGFCQAQQLDDAKRIFRKMQNNGIVPNAFSYTVLIKGFIKAKSLDDAIDFCLEMLENGHSPNVVTFTGLVHEFCNEKGIEEARNVINTLRQKGFLLDEKAVRTYLDKNGPTSPMVWEAIFGPKKTTPRAF